MRLKRVLITGSAGLIGSETACIFHARGFEVIGIDNDMRSQFFGADASTAARRRQLELQLPRYRHADLDIRDGAAVDQLFAALCGSGSRIDAVVHTAAQPSHDWAASDPMTDFAVNAVGTMNLLESTRKHCPEAAFIFTSTNKVYGDRPNDLPLVEESTRWELDPLHPYAAHGIDEQMSIDQTKHSVFGASKVAADVMVQEYGRYFQLNTVVFRGGCLTGPNHSGAQLHGFLSYLMRCAVTGQPYTIFGYKGKQVRDNIHASDLVEMFWRYCEAPRPGEVYNAGGGRASNCSMLEAIRYCEALTGRKMNVQYNATNRVGDHIWYVSDTRKFAAHYPGWQVTRGIDDIFSEIHQAAVEQTQLAPAGA
jgi:CDP-paratose 2-epimerase